MARVESIDQIHASIPTIGEVAPADVPEFSLEEARTALVGIYYAMGTHYNADVGTRVSIPGRVPPAKLLGRDGLSGYTWSRRFERKPDADVITNKFEYAKPWYHWPTAEVELRLPKDTPLEVPHLKVKAEFTREKKVDGLYESKPATLIATIYPTHDRAWGLTEVDRETGDLSVVDSPNGAELATLNRVHETFWRGIGADEEYVKKMSFINRYLARMKNQKPRDFDIMDLLIPKMYEMNGLRPPKR